jgi:hypothetical protein
VLIVAGAVVLILGWVGVSRYAYPADQLPYIISGGIGGLFLVGVGAMLWLSADLRDEWRMLRRIDEALRDQAGVALVVESPTAGSQPPSSGWAPDASDYATAEAPTAEHEALEPALVSSSAAATNRRPARRPAAERPTKRESRPKPEASKTTSGRSRPTPRRTTSLPSEP